MGSAQIASGLIALAFFFGGASPATTSSSPQAAAKRAEGPQLTVSPTSKGCVVSKTVMGEPPETRTDRLAFSGFGYGAWYVNADRTIWVRGGWQAGPKGNKVLWAKPPGVGLVITGREIDRAGSPPRAITAPGSPLLDGPGSLPRATTGGGSTYPWGFEVTGLYFDSPGCWEITARAGREELRFVIVVMPEGTPLPTSYMDNPNSRSER
jgi:hypothetical protein